MKASKLLFIIFSISTLFSCSSCGNKQPKREVVGISLIHPATITPTNDTIALNDTLKISIHMSDSLVNYGTNKIYNIQNYNFKMKFAIMKLIGKSLGEINQPASVNNFEINAIIGKKISTGSFSVGYDYDTTGVGYNTIYKY